MSRRSEHGSTQDSSRIFNEQRRSLNFPQNIAEGYVEIIARLVDTAESVVNVAQDNNPEFNSHTSGDIVRHTPAAMRKIAIAWNDGMVDVASAVIDFLDLQNWRMWREDRRRASTADPESGERVFSENEILNTARQFMRHGGRGGATLDGLIEHLRIRTSLPDRDLRALVSRHFLVDDDLVFLSRAEGSTGRPVDVPDSVEAHLLALGYTDLRRNVRLERLDDSAPRARLVAFEGDNPIILVYCATGSSLKDAKTDEDAKFQARALSKLATPKFIYITDGTSNRYYNMMEARVIEHLPRAGETV